MMALLLCLWMTVAQAARVAIEADSRSLVVGQTVDLAVKVIDGAPQGLPDIKTGTGLLLRYQGQAQQHVVSNFKSTRIVQFNYQLSGVETGTWSIGPVDVIVDGQLMREQGLTIRVGEAPQSQGDQPVISTMSDTAPFLGEVVVYRLQFKHKRPVVGVEWTRPTFDGFIEEKVAETSQREYQIIEDGEQYTVRAVEVPLVAAAVGETVVAPAVITARYRAQRRQRRQRRRGTIEDLFGDSPFFSSRSEVVSHTSAPQTVQIRALPEAGQPADFSGLVGRFKLSQEASATSVALGESITITHRLAGLGTLHGFRLPSVADDAGFRAYDDTPEIKARVQDGVFQSVASVKRAVVPEAVGTLVIPGIKIPVFDPVAEQYVTLTTPDMEVEVTPGEDGAGTVTSFIGKSADTRRDVESVGEDILPLTEPDRMQDATLAGALPLIGALPGVPLLMWLAMVVNSWLASRRVDPMVVQRRRLITLPSEPVARLAALEDIFREVAGLRLGLPAPGLDVDAVAALGEEAVAIYRAIERARYGGSEAGLDALASRVSRFVEGT